MGRISGEAEVTFMIQVIADPGYIITLCLVFLAVILGRIAMLCDGHNYFISDRFYL